MTDGNLSGGDPSRRGVAELVLRDAEARGLSRPASYALLAAPVVLGAIYLWGLTDPARYKLIVGEDHIYEWGQFAFYLIAAAASLLVARRLLSSRDRFMAAVWLALGVGLIGVAGEEIAWGQTVFGFETPPAWDEVNNQGETTLHNVPIMGHVAQTVLLALAAAGSVGVVLLTIWGSRNLRARLALLTPPLVLVPLFSLLVLIKALRTVQAILVGHEGSDLAEYGELGFSLALAVFAIITARSLARPAP